MQRYSGALLVSLIVTVWQSVITGNFETEVDISESIQIGERTKEILDFLIRYEDKKLESEKVCIFYGMHRTNTSASSHNAIFNRLVV